MVSSLPVIETQRMLLKICRPAYFSAVFPLFNSHDILDWLDLDYPVAPSVTKKFLRTARKKARKKSEFHFTIFLKSENVVCGSVGLSQINKQHRRCYLGYWLAPQYHRQGLITEAVCAVLDFAFDRLSLHKVQARTLTTNIPSIKVLEKLGFSRHGFLKDDMLKYGSWVDGYEFELLTSEWHAKRKDL